MEHRTGKDFMQIYANSQFVKNDRFADNAKLENF